MKALILASGYGTRLGDLTKDTPKPMIEINGKPIIEHIMTRLYMYGITDIIISIHYLPHMITNYIGNRALYFYEPKLLSHKEKLFALKNWLKDEDFLVVNGDTLTNLDYSQMIESHVSPVITAAMDEYRCVGSWIYPKDYFKYQGQVITPYRQENLKWMDCGTPERLEEARKLFI